MKFINKIKLILPWPIFYFFKKTKALVEDLPILLSFLINNKLEISLLKKLWIIYKCYRISYSVDSPHMESEIIRVIENILYFSKYNGPGVIVEAGSYKGSSAAKFSLAANLINRKLVIFDSFCGIPQHNEIHDKNIFGGEAYFPPGSYSGSLEEVKNNIEKFGFINICEFKKGWFEDTMPNFKEPILVAYIDVDLESSTKTCIKYLYPLLVSGGVLFSQDGHLPWVIKILNDENFWEKEVGCKKPKIDGLGNKKLLMIKKE
ncbi:MAG: TylF/MycF family methyltransferase [Patescibacteria group bacterium]|nr:TylF/MycF family methyltransferase [Patescibacteria group bacterium]